MKLRNKRTGEIREVEPITIGGFRSLAELNTEWEDVPEEPKEYWYIESDGTILQNHKPTYISHLLNPLKSIGNYFETKEEAEKAVEKLKAWKRLKDAGFEFKGWEVLAHDSPRINFNVHRKNSDDIVPFLDLLFSGEGGEE